MLTCVVVVTSNINLFDDKTLILLNSFIRKKKKTFKIFTKIKLLVVIIINCEFIKIVVVKNKKKIVQFVKSFKLSTPIYNRI